MGLGFGLAMAGFFIAGFMAGFFIAGFFMAGWGLWPDIMCPEVMWPVIFGAGEGAAAATPPRDPARRRAMSAFFMPTSTHGRAGRMSL